MGFNKQERRARIKASIRQKVQGTAECPRLTVFRSNTNIYAQLIDDEHGHTLASAGSLKNKQAGKASGLEQAKLVGQAVAEKAKAAGIGQVVFDRNGYRYHGRVKALAEAVREGGLNF